MTSTIPRTQRRWIYLYLKERDGEKCSACGRKDKRLEIDHVDANPANHNPANLRLLCHGCNVRAAIKRRTPKHKFSPSLSTQTPPSLDATSKVKEAVDYQSGSPEMQANDLMEAVYRNWLMAKLTRDGETSKEQAIASGAEISGSSINAARGYYAKMVSDAGPCYDDKPGKGMKKVVRLKPAIRRAIERALEK